jgi:redox-sensitive bicupin YhaK (pirin superfamily)
MRGNVVHVERDEWLFAKEGWMTLTLEPVTDARSSLAPRRVSRVWRLTDPAPTPQTDRQRFVIPPDDLAANDPLLLLAEDWFSAVGFDWHPHRGFDTVTYVVDGELEHKDSTGAHSVLGAGDVQWTTMGRAALHAELAYQWRGVHTLQLWLNLPARLKGVEPRYQNLRGADVPLIVDEGVRVRIFSGTVHGVSGPAQNHWPATMIDGRFEAGARFTQEVPGDHVACLYVLGGRLRIGNAGHEVAAGEVAWFEPEGSGATGISLEAREASHVVAYSAAPIGEPIAARGPFVMNTMQEIRQAFADFRNGEFGPIPDW